MSKSKGNINVSVENIFPLIKKFLYSDHEIFLRELISNATDATLKLKHLSQIGKTKVDVKQVKIEVKINKDDKTIHIIDNGIGMNVEEVKKYINEIAFSGAEEFLEKYKNSAKDSGIIGHFGLGFYSAFMVAKKVEILSKSHEENSKAIHWTCDGSPEYTLEEHTKENHGTEIILHIADDSKEFLEDVKIRELLVKYNKFMPIPIKFGTKKVNQKSDDNKKEKEIEVDEIINNSSPAWTKKPAGLKNADYLSFYRELYPMQFEEPLFNIHLNVDYPFHLTGILYFPKLKPDLSVQKDKIQLYQNQVFVTDNVEGIVPEFLTLLRGVIDSPDIPLNVSRSYLQADGNVKKIANYITKKVGDKLRTLYNKERESFEKKWNDIKIVIEYGMLSDDSFYEKAEKFALYPTVDGKYLTFEELLTEIKPNHTNKDEKTVILYTNDQENHHSYIEDAKNKNYTVLLLDSPIITHLMQKIESKNEKISFARVDADTIENLIQKSDAISSKLNEEESKTLKETIEAIISKDKFTVQVSALDSSSSPFKVTQPEFMRRMKDMQGTGGTFGMNHMPEVYNLSVNANHPLINKILDTKTKPKKEKLIKQSIDLALLSQGLLKGEELTKFINRSFEIIK